MERLYVAAQENHEREYIRKLCTMLWTVVYMGIDYVVRGKKIDEWEVMEKTPLKGMDEKCDMVELLLLLKGTKQESARRISIRLQEKETSIWSSFF
jgi:hypothetical protein